MLRIIPILSRRAWLAALLLVWGWQGAYAQSPAPDPLPSWNDGSARRAIVAFVDRVTEEGGPEFIPIEQRIATSTMTARSGPSSRSTSSSPSRSTG
jgi:hypothetical protein